MFVVGISPDCTTVIKMREDICIIEHLSDRNKKELFNSIEKIQQRITFLNS